MRICYHGSTILDTERHFAANSSFSVVHLGRDDREGVPHNKNVLKEIRTLLQEHKLIVTIRSSEESNLELPSEASDINCHHYDSVQELARWFYKVLTKNGHHATGGNPDR